MNKKFRTFSSKYLVLVALASGLCLFDKNYSYAQDLNAPQVKKSQSKKLPTLNIGGTTYSQISKSTPKETYKIVLNNSGKLSLDIFSSIKDYTNFVLTTEDNKEVFSSKRSNNGSDMEIKISESMYLNSGTYYLEVYGRTSPLTLSSPTYGDYYIKSKFESVNYNEVLSPNTTPLNKQVNGLLTWNDDTDTYKIVIPTKMKTLIEVQSYFDSSVRISDINGNILSSKNAYGEESKPINTDISVELDKGTYYLDFSSSRHIISKTTGKYNFQVKEDLNGWVQSNGKWYYYKKGVAQKGWLKLSDKWYYFNNKGEMLTGWVYVDGKWYYLRISGYMATGWSQVGDKWYYLNTNSGQMLVGWQKIDNEWYYLNNSGQMLVGWQKINNEWYYLYGSGKMASNTTIDGWKIAYSGVATKIK